SLPGSQTSPARPRPGARSARRSYGFYTSTADRPRPEGDFLMRFFPLSWKRRTAAPATRSVQPTLEPLEERCTPDGSFGPWGTPVNLGPMVNTTSNDQHPAISKDGLSLYITSDRSGGFGGNDIWVSHRASRDAPWGAPVNLGSTINTPF